MKAKISSTPAIRFLKQNKVNFIPHTYKYVEKGGTKASAEALNADEYIVIKTLVMEDDKQNPLIVLMHGTMNVSVKKLARICGVKNITPCSPEKAQKITGYLVGGTSPFGVKKEVKYFMEKSILDLDRIFINGGKRGLLVEINPNIINDLLRPKLVETGI
jgi:Cys-tRNA(Pro) deacylase